MIPTQEWKWFGKPGHFIGSHNCRFHLCTQVGDVLVSTVGEYWPERIIREIHAKVFDPEWLRDHAHLQGEYFDAKYMEHFGYQEIGMNRKFETMVFLSGSPCQAEGCDCGQPQIVGDTLDMDVYNTPGDATRGHHAMCEKWAAREGVSRRN